MLRAVKQGNGYRRLFPWCSCVLAAVILAGCASAPRGLSHKAARPVADIAPAVQGAEIQAFAKGVSQLQTGLSVYFADSPLGSGMNITGQDFYENALGEHCRLALAASAGRGETFAVCRQSDGSWRYAEPLTVNTGAH